MLVLGQGKPPAETVKLAGGAYVKIRPATSFDFYRVQSRVNALTAGLTEAEDKKQALAVLLGEDYAEPLIVDPDWLAAASEKLLRVQLALICADEWAGIGEADGTPCPLNEVNLTRLLRDRDIAIALDAVLFSRIHAERDEKNGFSALPNGGAGAAQNTAQTATPAATLAPPATG